MISRYLAIDQRQVAAFVVSSDKRREGSQFMTDSQPGFGGLGCGPSQLTEGEPGCIFLPQRVTNPVMNPVESPLGDMYDSASPAIATEESPENQEMRIEMATF